MKLSESLKLCLSILYSFTLLFSCSTIKHYTYDIRLEKPISTQTLYYENDTFSIAFTFNPKNISFEMYNKLEDGIRINWDEVSVSQNGIAKRIIHYETGTYKVTEVQPPTTIPPKSKMIDAFQTTDQLYYIISSGTRLLRIRDSYPESDGGSSKNREMILGLKGQRIVLYFPYYLRNQYYSKVFEFMIVDIVPK